MSEEKESKLEPLDTTESETGDDKRAISTLVSKQGVIDHLNQLWGIHNLSVTLINAILILEKWTFLANYTICIHDLHNLRLFECSFSIDFLNIRICVWFMTQTTAISCLWDSVWVQCAKTDYVDDFSIPPIEYSVYYRTLFKYFSAIYTCYWYMDSEIILLAMELSILLLIMKLINYFTYEMDHTWFEGIKKKSSKNSLYKILSWKFQSGIHVIKRQIAIGNRLFPLTILWILNELFIEFLRWSACKLPTAS